MITGQ